MILDFLKDCRQGALKISLIVIVSGGEISSFTCTDEECVVKETKDSLHFLHSGEFR